METTEDTPVAVGIKMKKTEETLFADGKGPRWRWFCERVLGQVEVEVMMVMDAQRSALDSQSADDPIMIWHFAFTQDARNYLVYNMLDTVFGFARHGERMLEIVHDGRFQDLVHFFMAEEHKTFMQAQSREEYFSTLTNRMLRLSKLAACLQADTDLHTMPDDVLPADPVDALFEFYPSDDRQPPQQASPDDTLKTLGQRVARAKLDDEKKDGELLSAIQAQKENHEHVRKYEKRMERLVALVKGMTQQMLQCPQDGENQVVSLFGRHLFFIAPPGSQRTTVDAFFTAQRNLARCYPRDRADALACCTCPDFVPLVKEATCLPESLLSHIEDCCRRHEKADDPEAEDTPAEDTPAEDTPAKDKPAEDTPAEDKPAEDKPAEDKPAKDKPEGMKTSPQKTATTEATSSGEPGAEKMEEGGDQDDGSAGSKPEVKQPAATETNSSNVGVTNKAEEQTSESAAKPKPNASEPTLEKQMRESLAALKLEEAKPQDSESKEQEPPLSPRQGYETPRNQWRGDKCKAVADPPSLAEVTSPTKLVQEAQKYFTDVKNLDRALEHWGGRLVFTIKGPKNVDYFCPLLGYLPLLPALKVLAIKPEPKA
ncbi:hypothetical protein ACOMHN_018746 [Nucella lapillus]